LWTRPCGTNQAGSIGVVTLDPPKRFIGDRLGVGGVVGTEVDVGPAACRSLSKTVRIRLWRANPRSL
jgi:hypothetical protein